jgi:hypothetical protein
MFLEIDSSDDNQQDFVFQNDKEVQTHFKDNYNHKHRNLTPIPTKNKGKSLSMSS